MHSNFDVLPHVNTCYVRAQAFDVSSSDQLCCVNCFWGKYWNVVVINIISVLLFNFYFWLQWRLTEVHCKVRVRFQWTLVVQVMGVSLAITARLLSHNFQCQLTRPHSSGSEEQAD